MSQMVAYKGTLKRTEMLENETLEEQCRRLIGDLELPEYYDSYAEFLVMETDMQYIILGETLYSVVKNEEIDNDLFEMVENKDGTFSFDVRYYNGGCCFEEALERAFRNKE